MKSVIANVDIVNVYGMLNVYLLGDFCQLLYPRSISEQSKLKVASRALEHTVSNVMKGLGYVCNCCGCCCSILRGIIDWGIENSAACSNYYAIIDADSCLGCGICRKRCQVRAIYEKGGVSVVDRKKCIDCGLCATGCPNGVAKLERKPERGIINPPENFETWEHERLRNRGLTK